MSANFTDRDAARLRRALELAHASIGVSEPNPRVGCVLADSSDRVVGEGHTQRAGGPHAEVMALRAAEAVGARVAGGTAWVTLEPCAHHGRTPPCADALVAAGLARVVVLSEDPFPLVAGRGIERLRAAGLEVVLAPEGDLTRAALALNIGFFSRVRRGRPWLRMKVAASLDGRTALADGSSQWITGESARADGHAWRRRAGAVISGIGTVVADDPRLDVRLVATEVQPLRVIVDARLSIAPDARVLAPPGRALIATTSGEGDRAAALRAGGAEVVALPDGRGRVDLEALVRLLAGRGVNELHAEAGATLNGALLQQGLVDECLVYLAPRLVGPGRDIATLPPLARLADATPLRFLDCERVADDLRLRALTPAGAAFVDG